MKQWFPILFFLLMPALLPAQAGSNPCDDFRNYVITNPEYLPIKRVRLVVHIFQKDDGSGNIPDNADGHSFLNYLFNHLNYYYREPQYMKPYPENKAYKPLTDTRVRFVIDTILYHRNTSDWDFRRYTKYYNPAKKDTLFDESGAWDRSDYLYKKYVTNNPDLSACERDSALHLLLVEAPGFQERGMAAGLYTCRWVYYVGAYYDMMHGRNHWSPGGTLAHEAGHAMGLTHPYDFGNKCTDVPFTSRGATNNMMDCWPHSDHAWTPMQAALVQWSLAGGSEMHKAVIRDWDTYHPDSAMHILGGDTVVWNGKMFLVGDLVIDRGAKLIINCTLNMPPGSTVKVKPGAMLVINGQITTDGNYTWNGLISEKGKRFLVFGRERRGKISLTGSVSHVDSTKNIR